MLRNPDLSWSALSAFARSMARMIEAGVDIRKSLQTASRQSPDRRTGPAVEKIRQGVSGGKTLTEAIREQGPLFPALFCDLVDVGEQTGHLPEVFAALARYYESRLKQLREFRSAVAWPIIQFVAAIGIIGLLIFILGLLPPAGADGKPFDVTGLGLSGTSGAVTWVCGWLAIAIAGYTGWKFTRNQVSGQQMLDPWLLRIPVLGTCLQSFAISRFAWCFSLTQQSGMSIRPSLECSFRASENGAFTAAAPQVWKDVADGTSLTDAFVNAQIFPDEFLQVVATAEETGTVPEQLSRMSHIFEDQARRSMSRLTAVLSSTVWVFTAGLIIYFIFRLAMIYVGTLNEANRQVFG